MHLVLMYCTEALAGAFWVAAVLRNFELPVATGALSMTIITCTFHITYFLSEIYERLSKVREWGST